MTQPSGIRCYRFGPYLLDAHRSQLRRGDTLIPLAQKTVDVLAALIEHPAISKADLMQTVWPGTVVEENNLARHISTLRKALQERPDQHEYILTIPGHGYRFVADVERVEKGPRTSGDVPASPAETGSQPLQPSVPLHNLRGRWQVAVLLSGLLVPVALATAWLVVTGTSTGDAIGPATAIRPLTFGRGLEQQPTWSPDGRFVAYASDAAGNSDIWVVAVDDPNPTRLTDSEAHDVQPAWSPDGRWIAFRSEHEGGGLFVVPATGGPSRRIAPFGFRPSWSPSGATVLFSGQGPNPTLYLVAADGASAPQPLEHEALRELTGRRAAWLPDGERVSVLGRLRDRQWRFVTLPAGGGPAVTSRIAPEVVARLKAEPVDIGSIVWSASADFLYFSGRSSNVVNLWRVSTDPATLDWTGGLERLTTGAGDDQDPALSADSSRVAFTVARTLTRIWSVPFDSATGRLTGDPRPLTPGEPGEYDAAVPPDATRLVYRTVRGSRQELWERSLGDGSDRLLLASREWAPTSPRWSRDGTQLAFTRRGAGERRREGDGTVVILSPATGLEHAIPTPGFVDVVPDDWTADGRWILASCRSRAGAFRETCLLSTSDARQADLKVIASDATRDLIFQRFSPDGRWISFIAQDPADLRTSTVYTMPAAGGPWTAVTSGAFFENNSRWAPDGRTLYFVSNRGGSRNVWGRHFDPSRGLPTGEPFRVTHFDSPARQLAVNRDGNFEMSVTADRLFLPVTETAGNIWLLGRPAR